MKRKTWKLSKEELAQQAQIRQFDHEIISYDSNGFPPSWGRRFWRGIIILIAAIPVQSLYGEPALQFMATFWIIYATILYLMRYTYIRENGKQISFYQKMKYLPVSERQIKLVRVMYLYDFWKTTFILAAAAQLGSVLLIYQKISIENILFILLLLGVMPWLGGLAYIRFKR